MVLAQKPWIVPILGTTKLRRLKENIGAADIQFTDAELQEMEAASAEIKILGSVIRKRWRKQRVCNFFVRRRFLAE